MKVIVAPTVTLAFAFVAGSAFAEGPLMKSAAKALRTELAAQPGGVRFLPEQQPTSVSAADFDEWSVRLERARSQRDNSKRVLAIGGVMAGAGALLALLNEVSTAGEFSGDPDPARRFLAATGVLVGSAVAGYGGIRYVQAAANVERLEREGVGKGYLTLRILPGEGVRLAVHLSF
jgi:hypothetical protein